MASKDVARRQGGARRWLFVLVSFALAVVGSIVTPGSASAAPTFKAPFKCGQVWHASTYGNEVGTGHGPGEHAVDFNMYPHSAELGQPILASAAGTVTATGDVGYGNRVTIDHGGGWTTYYGHLSSISVSKGAKIDAGAQIGIIGNTGTGNENNDGVHLHFDQRLNGVYQWVAFDGKTISVGNSATASAPTITSTNGCASGGGQSVPSAQLKDGRVFLPTASGPAECAR
ncbi:MAG TPA: M23 family metallopeptidase, partial [Arachnia sp.]|nr:M23 family metallopeptidase [Arachnia sp.]